MHRIFGVIQSHVQRDYGSVDDSREKKFLLTGRNLRGRDSDTPTETPGREYTCYRMGTIRGKIMMKNGINIYTYTVKKL